MTDRFHHPDDREARSAARVRVLEALLKRDVDHPPAEFVEAARLDAARRMLVDSSTPLQRIAYMCGFGDAGTMRRAFVRTLGTNPADYRKRFRTTTAC